MEQQNQSNEMLVRQISQPLARSAGWMKFIGVIMIILGVLTALTIVGIIIAWLPIWIGVLLIKSANKAKSAYNFGYMPDIVESLRALNSYFTIYGVLLILYLIASIVFIIIAILFGTFFESIMDLV
jgi:uncharacterized membrane protein HdeD (DUF308 family)